MKQFQNGTWKGQKNSQWAGHVSRWLHMHESGLPRLALIVAYIKVKMTQQRIVRLQKSVSVVNQNGK